jgi:protein-tyrosine phosphatase
LRFLIVCTANICRSPMGEAVMRHALAARGLKPEVGSAGIDAPPDIPAHEFSAQAVAEAGLGDLSTHRSRLISPLMVRDADMVLCMEQMHRGAVVTRVPDAAGRVRLLGHWQEREVPDPVGRPVSVHRECLELIRECVDQWIERLSRQGLLQ